jgi:hemerythrin
MEKLIQSLQFNNSSLEASHRKIFSLINDIANVEKMDLTRNDIVFDVATIELEKYLSYYFKQNGLKDEKVFAMIETAKDSYREKGNEGMIDTLSTLYSWLKNHILEASKRHIAATK